MAGDFVASVNGRAPVRGAVAPASGGTAARILSDDAGAVLAASGIFSTARGGALDLTLRPRGRPGEYDGDARISNISVRDAPVLAELLGAISVIGLLEQLNDSGLVFTSAEAQFRTSSEGIVVSRGSAVGASLGVSMEGSYATTSRTLNMRGVISPIYLINQIGSVLTRPGEGVFGFNYDLTGSVDDPQVSVNPAVDPDTGHVPRDVPVGCAKARPAQEERVPVKLSDFDFDLPERLIATRPARPAHLGPPAAGRRRRDPRPARVGSGRGLPPRRPADPEQHQGHSSPPDRDAAADHRAGRGRGAASRSRCWNRRPRAGARWPSRCASWRRAR